MNTEPVDGATRRAFAFRSVALAAGWSAAVNAAASRQHIEVGPGRRVKSLAEASRLAVSGALVSVDAGDYVGDTAVWVHDGVELRAVGGRVRLIAGGASAEDKGIWVVRARGMAVDGFDFVGAAVAGRNGAGIRLESGSLRVRDCAFMHNEMGLLTSNDPTIELDIEDSEFAHNKRPDGHNHNLYAGSIKRLSIVGSYLHHGHIGHLLKSRAALNHIAYNRLTDEADGRASYELEFPNGGVAHVVGNIIQQGPLTDNPRLVAYGAEGYRWPVNELHLVHNTLVDDRAEPGRFLGIFPGGDARVRASDNLLVGGAAWDAGADAELHNNVMLSRVDLGTAPEQPYHPKPGAVVRLRPVDAAAQRRSGPLTPSRQYLHPRRSVALQVPPTLPGALQPDAPARP